VGGGAGGVGITGVEGIATPCTPRQRTVLNIHPSHTEQSRPHSAHPAFACSGFGISSHLWTKPPLSVDKRRDDCNRRQRIRQQQQGDLLTRRRLSVNESNPRLSMDAWCTRSRCRHHPCWSLIALARLTTSKTPSTKWGAHRRLEHLALFG
jgi:hypothetical protein